MSKLQLKAGEKLDLLAYLEALLGYVKSLEASVGAITNDLAAIRNMMFDDPEDIAMCRSKLRLAATTAKPIAEESKQFYGELLHELSDPPKYLN